MNGSQPARLALSQFRLAFHENLKDYLIALSEAIVNTDVESQTSDLSAEGQVLSRKCKVDFHGRRMVG